MFAVAARLIFAKSQIFIKAKRKRTKNKLEMKYNASLPLILKNWKRSFFTFDEIVAGHN